MTTRYEIALIVYVKTPTVFCLLAVKYVVGKDKKANYQNCSSV